ncbi:MAG: hypothetical protein Q8Q12_06180 [bacterium]|nr:hypothetical protein [bacterium]
MGLMRVILCVLVVFLGWAAPAATTEAQPQASDDELAIRALMERINLACNADTAEKGVEIMRGVVSDKGYTVVQPNAERMEAFVGDKKALCDALSQSLRNGPKWGVHKVQQITIVGFVAYEIGETKDPNQDPKAAPNTWLNVFAKEDVGWKLVFSTPAAAAQKAFRRPDAREGESAK